MVVWRNKLNGMRLYFFCLFFTFICLIISGCDEGSYSSNGQGGSVDIQFSSQGSGEPKALPEVTSSLMENGQAAPAEPFYCPDVTQSNCSAAAIETIQVLICNAQNAIVAQSPQWRIEDGGGRISGVPPGDGYRIVVLGRSEGCGVIFRSERSGLRVTAGQTTDAGYFDVDQYGFVPLSETMNYNGTNLEWNPVPGAVQYHIQITLSDDVIFSAPVIDEIISDTTFNTSAWIPPLEAYGNYAWRISAIDSYGNSGAWSNILFYKETFGNCIYPIYF